jgi:hypothetical protein
MKLNDLTHRLLLTSSIILYLGALSLRPGVAYGPEGPGQAAEGNLRVRFLDSATGYAIQPDEIHVVTGRAGARTQPPPVRAVSRSGHLALALANGQHTLEVGAANYFPLAGQVVAGESDRFNINFVLDPISPPRELQNDYIDTLRRADATVFVGFVADEETGQPLRNVSVRSLPSGVATRTDERGFFQIHVPLPGGAASSSLLFEKGGYRTHERQHLELWANGDWIYRISLVPGNGREVVDERTTRRHSPSRAGGITVQETSLPASREATVSSTSESTGVTADGPISASSTSNFVVRVPRTIRVLRQDNVTIDYLSLETYTKRVLPSEWIASWASYGGGSGINSLKAGAVAVRAFGAGYVSSPLTSTYDICGTTACQAYVHTANNSSANTAVDQTVNYVMLPPGAVRITFKLTEYSAENNALSLACGDGFSGNSGSCISDPVCTGESRNGHGRGM